MESEERFPRIRNISVHTDCTLYEVTTRVEAASVFPRRDSASQFQPMAVVFHRRMWEPASSICRKRYSNRRFFSLSSPLLQGSLEFRRIVSYRIYVPTRPFRRRASQYAICIDNRTGSHAGVLKGQPTSIVSKIFLLLKPILSILCVTLSLPTDKASVFLMKE